MSSVPNSVETVNAAATAIVAAETRVQPTSVPKRGWGSWWSLYWCFGSYKHKNKRIGHAVLVPEPVAPVAAAPVSGNPNHPTTIVFPFIAPPSSPASFLQSDPPSATQSPAGSLSLTALSMNAFSQSVTSSAFAIGPYAHETQLVTPPVFSAVNTEPSTACFTPPPESAQMTTPPSPEVPFAQLLTSSLARNRRHNGSNMKFPLSQYDYQPYQCPGSPGSTVSYLGYEHFSARKWGSGSLTPNGWGSRLGSGTQTPNGGLSRLGSGAMTPNGVEPPSRDSYILDSQISEVASDNESQDSDTAVHYRVSFELTGGEYPSCREKVPTLPHDLVAAISAESNQPTDLSKEAESSCKYSVQESVNAISGDKSSKEEGQTSEKHPSTALDLSKDFDFDNVKPEVLNKSSVDCEWWTSDKAAGKEPSLGNKWTFFPLLQPKVS